MCIVLVSVRARVSFSVAQQNSPISCDTRGHATPPFCLCCHPFHLSCNAKAFFGRTANTHTHALNIHPLTYHAYAWYGPAWSHELRVRLLVRALLRNLIVLIAICLDRSNLIRICYAFNETLRS